MKALLLLVLGVTTLAAEGAPITTADISYCKSFLMMAEQDETTSGLEMNAGIGSLLRGERFAEVRVIG